MKIQLGHTFSDIISVDNLLLAWQEFVRGKRGKPDVQEFGRYLMDNIMSLHEELKNFTYRHGGYYNFFVSDPKPRSIHKASVRDRLVHHAIHRLLYPFFDRTFISDSFACRVNKGLHRAINRLRDMAHEVSQNHMRTCWVLKCDIRKFFAHIDHAVLMGVLGEYIPDKNILWLLQEIIGSFHVAPGRGLPLGNLTSQLFVNVYMNVFDQFVKHKLKARYYVRYADDFVLLSHDRAWLAAQLLRMQEFLQERLHLTMHPQKISLQTFASGVDFLGWVHFSDHRVLRTVTKRRMMRKIRANPAEATVQSYLGLLRHGNTMRLQRDVLGNARLSGNS
ncbi:MAG: reverse transcriptase/maturase family protein [Patescibacteria group bacterium]